MKIEKAVSADDFLKLWHGKEGWFFNCDMIMYTLDLWEISRDCPHLKEKIYLNGATRSQVAMHMAMRGVTEVFITQSGGEKLIRLTADQFCGPFFDKLLKAFGETSTEIPKYCVDEEMQKHQQYKTETKFSRVV